MSDATDRGSSGSDGLCRLAMGMGMFVGVLGLAGAILLLFSSSTSEVVAAAPVSLLASAVAFGLVAIAAARR
ncbi:MAG: hypothetical protein ABFE16_16685 [Armatimonadia bacterium]